MEPKMNFYYPEDDAQETVDDPSGEAGTASFPKPKTRKEYFLAKFLSTLNGLSLSRFNALPFQEIDKDDLQYAWLVRKFVSRRPFTFNEKANAYVLPIDLAKIAKASGINIRSIRDFSNKNSNIMAGMYYEVIIDNTYSCKVSPNGGDSVTCGSYEIVPENIDSFYITSETEPTHIPVVDVYIHYIIYKQPKSTLEYYIAKAAGYPLLNTDNPPEPKTTEEIYWAYVCKESGGSGAEEAGSEDPDGNS